VDATAWIGLVDDATSLRLQNPRARTLDLARLESGTVGVVCATVQSVSALHAFQRRDGGEGLRAEVILVAGGSTRVTLWDDDTRLVQDGTFRVGSAVQFLATVLPGLRDLELQVAGPITTQPPPTSTISGRLTMSPPLMVGRAEKARITAIAHLDGPHGGKIVLDGALIAEAEQHSGQCVRFDGVCPNPALDGWFFQTPEATLSPEP